MNTYDEGKYGEETSIHTRKKIGSENKNKVFIEEEKADYLNNLRNKYSDQKSIEQQFAEAKLVPEKDKEHIAPALIVGGAALIYRYGPEITEAAVKYGPLLLSMILDPPEINKKDEIDNLDDIKNFKPIVISNNEDIKKVETLDVEEDILVMLTKGSTKNERKSNPKKVTKAKEELQKLKEELKELNKKPNKTPEDKRRKKVIEKKINKELSKMQKSENHSQIGKHS